MTVLEKVIKIWISLSTILFFACASQVNGDLQISADGERIIYSAVPGESALSTLERYANVRTKTEEFGQFITAINGIEGLGEDFFWAFFVNGVKSREGAGSLKGNSGDVFEWRLIRRKRENAASIISVGPP